MRNRHLVICLALGFGFFVFANYGAYSSEHIGASEFIVKGAGARTCEDFTAHAASQDFEFGLYAGWVEGYLTAYNAFDPDTYDITPFQSTRYLAVLLESHCTRHPDMSFFKAVSLMVRSLHPYRLHEKSIALQIRSKTHSIKIYESTLKVAKVHLRSAGYNMTRGPSFSLEDSNEVIRYQDANGIAPTGVFDEETLSRMVFRRK